MAKVIDGMTMSIDGFVADDRGNAGELYPDLDGLRDTAYMTDTIAQTGAVLMGRRTFAMGDPDEYVGNYEFQVPIFVLTHRAPPVPPRQDEHLTFTFVTDGLASAVRQATTAAGDRAVQVVGGVDVIGNCWKPGRSMSCRSTSCRCCSAPGCDSRRTAAGRNRRGSTRSAGKR